MEAVNENWSVQVLAISPSSEPDKEIPVIKLVINSYLDKEAAIALGEFLIDIGNKL